jgi:hypothetical protein
MGRYVTPLGVVIEMAEKAALAVGYKAESLPESAPFVDEEEATEPKRPPGRPKKIQN